MIVTHIAVVKLSELFQDLFDETEFRDFVEATFGREVARSLPGAGTAPGSLVYSGARVLERRGLLGGELYAALVAQRPGEAGRIHALWTEFGLPGRQDAPPPGPPPPGPRPPEPRPPEPRPPEPVVPWWHFATRTDRLRVVLDIHDGQRWDQPKELQNRQFSCVYDAPKLGLRGVPGGFCLSWTTEQLQRRRKLLRQEGGVGPGAEALREWGLELRRAFSELDGLAALVDQRRDVPVEIVVRASSGDLVTIPWELIVLGTGRDAMPVVLRENTVLVRSFSGSQAQSQRALLDDPGGSVLFAWSETGGTLSMGESALPDLHRAQLQASCGERIPLGEVPKASPRAIRAEAARLAASGHPPRVLHLLCHGASADARTWGLALDHSLLPGKRTIVDSEAFRTLLGEKELRTVTTVVLCACDGGNEGMDWSPLGSVAAAAYFADVSTVASQFPLSKLGSVELTRELYTALLKERLPLPAAHERAVRTLRLDLSETGDWLDLVLLVPFSDERG